MFPVILIASNALAEKSTFDLIEDGAGAWASVDAGWEFRKGEIIGASSILDGAITDPAASTFLVSRKIFGGDIVVSIVMTFDTGRYIWVYLDFDQETQTGIWIETGHLPGKDAADNEVERAYTKTVDDTVWTVRATGELVVQPDMRLHLRFERKSDYYSIYSDNTLMVTYRKPGGYPAGPLQIRLTNASARIHRLEIESDWIDSV